MNASGLSKNRSSRAPGHHASWISLKQDECSLILSLNIELFLYANCTLKQRSPGSAMPVDGSEPRRQSELREVSDMLFDAINACRDFFEKHARTLVLRGML